MRRDARLGRRRGDSRATVVIGELVERCWDVIVVGAGLGGGIAGRRLAEKGLSVLFVESGPATPREDWNGWTAATVTGRQVCEPAPCGDGVFHVNVVESAVDNQMTSSGPRARAFIKARMFVTIPDGQVPYDFTFWDTEYGSSGRAAQLVDMVASQLAGRFAAMLRLST